jgi:predicted flap endonuclease-1-like 5' DNA nuclease
MSPIEDRLLGFVLGVLTGWVAHWLLQRWRGRRPPQVVHREGLADAFGPVVPPATAPAVLSAIEVSAHVRVVDVGAARAAGFNIRHMDDLTIIEGIGPKIDDLLHANGIVSFADLAVQRVEDLVAILDRAGASFRLANPDSWPRQAQLAADNQWTDLKRLQRDMIGGLPPAEPRT